MFGYALSPQKFTDHRIMESFKLEKTFMIIKSNCKAVQKHYFMYLSLLLTTELRSAVRIFYFCSCVWCFQRETFILDKGYRQKILKVRKSQR